MKVVILCGGMGTRLRELTEVTPKPMIPIGNYPICWHIMKYFSSYGYSDFVLCLGYKKGVFIDFFLNYREHNSDITVHLGENNATFHNNHDEEDWNVTLADTGMETNTGGRIKRIEKYIEDDNFFLTYGDGLSNVDLNDLTEMHSKNGKIITVTGVHPSSRFGEIKISKNLVESFNEKPQTSESYINGGFMVINRHIFRRYMDDNPDLDFESEVMPSVARDGEMTVYRHDGFWQCMDTSREYQLLNTIWGKGSAPWKRW
ncbi:MAG: glucose-1-phosphate cytidylyltransferase [Deltaproteobacteria bacterium]|nr:glucose-1-phosphate cytidylyltransferase [Deltaproteobacteria bacterium]